VWNSFLIQRWEKVRKAGKGRFIIIHGVIGWGCLTAILVSILSALTSGFTWSIGPVIKNFVTYPIGGVFFGWWLWNYFEEEYIRGVGKIPGPGRKGR